MQQHRTNHTKRTQGTMEATREGALPGSLVQPREGMQADGDGFHAPEANTQASFFGRDAGGSVGVLRAWHAWREASRTWETLEVPAPQGSREVDPTTRRTAEDLRGVRSAHSTARQARRSPEEGADGVMEPAQETLSGHEGLEQTMPTSLQGRATQAAHDTSSRWRHLCGMLTVA